MRRLRRMRQAAALEEEENATEDSISKTSGSISPSRRKSSSSTSYHDGIAEILQSLPPIDQITGMGFADPFEMYPVRPRPFFAVAIHHWANVVAPGTPFMSFEGGARTSRWWSVTMHDPLLFSAAILTSITMLSQTSHGRLVNELDVLKHKGRTIRLFNEALRDCQKNCTNEALAAVLQLAGHELFLGSKQVFDIHFLGVANMVSLMGGLDSATLDPLLRQTLLLQDQIRFSMTGRAVFCNTDDSNTLSCRAQNSQSGDIHSRLSKNVSKGQLDFRIASTVAPQDVASYFPGGRSARKLLLQSSFLFNNSDTIIWNKKEFSLWTAIIRLHALANDCDYTLARNKDTSLIAQESTLLKLRILSFTKYQPGQTSDAYAEGAHIEDIASECARIAALDTIYEILYMTQDLAENPADCPFGTSRALQSLKASKLLDGQFEPIVKWALCINAFVGKRRRKVNAAISLDAI